MRVFGRSAVLAGLLCVSAASSAAAASISSVVVGSAAVPGTACTFQGATTACSAIAVGPLDPGTLAITGAFQFDNDIALFDFSVNNDVLFAATTSSFRNGGFDPVLALYTSAGVLVPNGPFFAVNDDISFDEGKLDAQLSNILLSPGSYLLALTQTGNLPQEILENCVPGLTPSDPPRCTGGFDQASLEFACYTAGFPDLAMCTAGAPGLFAGLTADFALDLTVDPVLTAVREPGTLSLLALGSAGAALARRRRARQRAV